MVVMRKIIVWSLLATLWNAIPVAAYSQETPGPAGGAGTKTTHETAVATTTVGTEVGVIAVAISILGLIALAASSSSGDSTPAATHH